MVRQAKARSSRSLCKPASDEFIAFTSSVGFDHRLWKYDIAGSIAHARSLADAHVISKKELNQLEEGLRSIAKDFARGAVCLDPALEDIHMNIESQLTERVEETGAKLHTGRSRNDQVALDARLATRAMTLDTISKILALQSVITDRAKESIDVAVPGYTHLQHAQPVLLAHHLLAHFWRLERDSSRLFDCCRRTNVSPLGSGALAGTSFELDREAAAQLLGMTGTTENSMDAVSDRDFVAEAVFCCSMVMTHLSALCEEIVCWSSREFGFIKLPNSLAGGSSMMPQKVNPDIPELVRGKTGRVVGDLVAVLTLLKSLPLAYNRDLQEDKESLFDAFDTVGVSLHALTTILAELVFDKVRMRKAAEVGMMTATDLADLLTRRGVPFRKAHGIVRELVEESSDDDAKFIQLANKMLSENARGIHPGKVQVVDIDSSIETRRVRGGTSRAAIEKQLTEAGSRLTKNAQTLDRFVRQASAVDALVGL